MLTRIGAHIRKELLMLLRDRGGLALIYLMPVCLVCIMAVVQDAPFRDFSEKQVHVLFRDHDGGAVGRGIRQGLEGAGPFAITEKFGPTPPMMNFGVTVGKCVSRHQPSPPSMSV